MARRGRGGRRGRKLLSRSNGGSDEGVNSKRTAGMDLLERIFRADKVASTEMMSQHLIMKKISL